MDLIFPDDYLISETSAEGDSITQASSSTLFNGIKIFLWWGYQSFPDFSVANGAKGKWLSLLAWFIEKMSVRKGFLFLCLPWIWPGVCVTASVHFLLIFSLPSVCSSLRHLLETGMEWVHTTPKVLIKCKRRVYQETQVHAVPGRLPWSACLVSCLTLRTLPSVQPLVKATYRTSVFFFCLSCPLCCLLGGSEESGTMVLLFIWNSFWIGLESFASLCLTFLFE